MRDVSDSFELIGNSFSIFVRKPVLILPMLLAWLIYAPSVIYLKFFYLWKQHPELQNILVVFGLTVMFSVSLCFSCAWLLEMLQDIDEGKEIRLFDTFKRVLVESFYKILPIALVWAFLWFILSVINALLKSEETQEDHERSVQAVAETLAGYEKFSFSRVLIDALQKGIRMAVFLVIPAIAWEGYGTKDALKRGIAIFKARLKQFTFGYVLTWVASGWVFLPVFLCILFGTKHDGKPPLIEFPPEVWVGVIIYTGFAWSFSIYLEQMYMACLYRWHMKWEGLCKEALSKGQPLPEFNAIQPPVFLKSIPEMKKYFSDKDH